MADRRPRDPIPMPSQSSMDLDVVRSNSELNPADGDPDAYYPGSSGMGAVVVHHLVTAMLIAMVIGLGTWGYLTVKSASPFARPKNRPPSPFERSAADAQVDRFHFALAVYWDLYGKYPPALDALVDEGLLQPSDLDYPPGSTSIVYQRTGETYQIVVERTVTKTEVVSPQDASVPAPSQETTE